MSRLGVPEKGSRWYNPDDPGSESVVLPDRRLFVTRPEGDPDADSTIPYEHEKHVPSPCRCDEVLSPESVRRPGTLPVMSFSSLCGEGSEETRDGARGTDGQRLGARRALDSPGTSLVRHDLPHMSGWVT